MKAKKVVKKLTKVEALLSSIIDQYDTGDDARLQQELNAAKESVRRAQKTVNNGTEPKTVKKPAAKAGTAKNGARRKVRVAAAG